MVDRKELESCCVSLFGPAVRRSQLAYVDSVTFTKRINDIANAFVRLDFTKDQPSHQVWVETSGLTYFLEVSQVCIPESIRSDFARLMLWWEGKGTLQRP